VYTEKGLLFYRETSFEFETPTTAAITTQQKKTKELEKTGIVGKTWTGFRATAGNRTG
jgi:hypothetical protein